MVPTQEGRISTRNVIGMASHMLVAAKFVAGPRPRAHRQNKSKNVIKNSDMQMSGAQSTGVHLALSNGYQGGPSSILLWSPQREGGVIGFTDELMKRTCYVWGRVAPPAAAVLPPAPTCCSYGSKGRRQRRWRRHRSHHPRTSAASRLRAGAGCYGRLGRRRRKISSAARQHTGPDCSGRATASLLRRGSSGGGREPPSAG